MSQHPQELRHLAPSELRPDRLNARAHSAAQIKQIVASIQEFGFVGAILADESLNIIAGHGRLVAAQQCNLPAVPVFIVSNLTEAERRALALADNKIALNAGWDVDLLRQNLELVALELDVELTGFSVGQVDVVLSGPSRRDPGDELIPAAPTNPETRRGDIGAADSISSDAVTLATATLFGEWLALKLPQPCFLIPRTTWRSMAMLAARAGSNTPSLPWPPAR
ncbi:MAG: ParB/Srx family N-terminal domain-containing protein [Terricaulis sp.]